LVFLIFIFAKISYGSNIDERNKWDADQVEQWKKNFIDVVTYHQSQQIILATLLSEIDPTQMDETQYEELVDFIIKYPAEDVDRSYFGNYSQQTLLHIVASRDYENVAEMLINKIELKKFIPYLMRGDYIEKTALQNARNENIIKLLLSKIQKIDSDTFKEIILNQANLFNQKETVLNEATKYWSDKSIKLLVSQMAKMNFKNLLQMVLQPIIAEKIIFDFDYANKYASKQITMLLKNKIQKFKKQEKSNKEINGDLQLGWSEEKPIAFMYKIPGKKYTLCSVFFVKSLSQTTMKWYLQEEMRKYKNNEKTSSIWPIIATNLHILYGQSMLRNIISYLIWDENDAVKKFYLKVIKLNKKRKRSQD